MMEVGEDGGGGGKTLSSKFYAETTTRDKKLMLCKLHRNECTKSVLIANNQHYTLWSLLLSGPGKANLPRRRVTDLIIDLQLETNIPQRFLNLFFRTATSPK